MCDERLPKPVHRQQQRIIMPAKSVYNDTPSAVKAGAAKAITSGSHSRRCCTFISKMLMAGIGTVFMLRCGTGSELVSSVC